MTNQNDTLRLNCLIESESTVFIVPVGCNDEFSDLKEIIQKKREKDSLKDVDPHTLELWKPKDSNPIVAKPSNTLVERIGSLGDDLRTFADNLEPVDSVLSFFPTHPSRDYIHIIVKVSRTTITPSSSRPSRGLSVALKLGPDEADRTDQIAFMLYDGLWTKNGTLSDITETREECIPSLNPDDDNDILYDDSAPSPDVTMREPETPKASFVNLSLLNPGLCEEKDFLATKFLVRDEYLELYRYLNEPKVYKEHVLLLGQPGIGKTIFLTFCLLQRLISHRPTIFAPSTTQRYIFLPSGVHSIPDAFHRYKDPILAQDYLDSLVLQDINQEQPDIQCFRRWRMLVSSSPQLPRYKRWRKEKQPKIFVMKTWAWEEVFTAREFAYKPRTTDQWRTVYLKYGGSARFLFADESFVELEVTTALENCTDIGTLFPTYAFKNDTSSALVQMNPRTDKDMKLDRSTMFGQINSGYILEKLLELKKQAVVDTFGYTFNKLFTTDVTRNASGVLFEVAGHRHLLASCANPLDIRRLSTDSPQMKLDLRHVQKTWHFDRRDIKPFSEHDPKYYCRPLVGNLVGFDVFALEVDGDQCPIAVVFFQFTTSTDHPIKTTFFEKLWIKHQFAKKMVKWKFIFVVPQVIESEYVAQPLTPPSAGQKWEEEVEQYVLGVDMKKVWDGLRQEALQK